MSLAWGAAAMLCGWVAQAAPKNAAQAGSGGAGAAATPGPAPSSGASAPTPPASAAAPAPEATSPSGAAPASPDAAVAAPTAPAPEADSDEDEEEQAREAARKKRERRRRMQLESQRDEELGSAPAAPVAPPAPPPEEWRLVDSHVLLGVERITNLLSWSYTRSVPTTSNLNGSPSTTNIDLETSGTDVSFLGSGASQNLLSVPRVALDGMFSNGLTLGGSISYMVTSGKSEIPNGDGINKTSVEDPTVSIFIFAPRIGVVIPASPTVGVWLRGGISRISASTDTTATANPQAGASGATITSTMTLVDLTLDPQLVITPVPHVGITVGALLDIGVSGSIETSGSDTSTDIKGSAYGVTGGLVAIF